MTAHCPGCHEDRPLEQFGKASWRKSGRAYKCKFCQSRAAKEWAAKNPDRIKARNDAAYKKWREKNPIKAKPEFITADGRLCRTCATRKPDTDFVLEKRGPNGRGWRCKACANEAIKRWDRERPYRLRRGGQPLDALKTMFEAQGGKCVICKTEISIEGNRRHAGGAYSDHCHKSGKLRELLCPTCNSGLGSFKDSQDILASAIAYLEKHKP